MFEPLFLLQLVRRFKIIVSAVVKWAIKSFNIPWLEGLIWLNQRVSTPGGRLIINELRFCPWMNEWLHFPLQGLQRI